MARRKKKKNNIFKSVFNLVLLIVLLFALFFLIQRFILPIWQGKQISEKVPEEVEKIEEELFAEVKEAEVTLYFSDESAQYLVPESRKVALTDYPAKLAIEELIKGPENSKLYPTIPQTTKINGLYVSDRIAYIDFSSEIKEDHPGGSTGELLTVYSVVMTLTSFPDIDKVQLLVDGNSGETLVGHVDITIPLERDDQWLRR